MQYQDVIYTKENNVATVTLNRPERMNAFTTAMVEGVARAFEDAAATDEIRMILVTGAGRAFSAGLDLKEPAILDGTQSSRLQVQMLRLPVITASIDKPIMAVLNGAAIGWGLELALLCDMRIAAENAQIGDRHINFSLVPDFGGLFQLPRLVGWAKACELFFGAQFIDGKEAERIGLVNKAVPHERLESYVQEIVQYIKNQPPMALQSAKRAMRNGLYCDLKTSQDYVIALQGTLVGTEDFREAMTALAEKRQPHFVGR